MGRKGIDWRIWQGRERVTDAGCGIGKLTRILAQNIQSVVVCAVYNDSNIILVASRNLKGIGNV